MESRLVEQHRGFTPLPLSSLWCACAMTLPVFCFLSFSTLNAFFLNHISMLAHTFTYSLLAPPTVLCELISVYCFLECFIHAFSICPASPLVQIKKKREDINAKQ